MVTTGTSTGILPPEHWATQVREQLNHLSCSLIADRLTRQQPAYDKDATDCDSVDESTASLTSSIYQYRTIHGRTYHAERGDAQYW